jgi:hypothetical protein
VDANSEAHAGTYVSQRNYEATAEFTSYGELTAATLGSMGRVAQWDLLFAIISAIDWTRNG